MDEQHRVQQRRQTYRERRVQLVCTSGVRSSGTKLLKEYDLVVDT